MGHFNLSACEEGHVQRHAWYHMILYHLVTRMSPSTSTTNLAFYLCDMYFLYQPSFLGILSTL